MPADPLDLAALEGRDDTAALTKAVRAELLMKDSSRRSGTSRHWIRDWFVPSLLKEGYVLRRADDVDALLRECRESRETIAALRARVQELERRERLAAIPLDPVCNGHVVHDEFNPCPRCDVRTPLVGRPSPRRRKGTT